MLLLVAYDVNTETKDGEYRLRQVAKYCESYGQRVQNSVFECVLDYSQYAYFKHEIAKLIDLGSDNIRIYNLGNKYKNKIESIGAKKLIFDQKDILVI